MFRARVSLGQQGTGPFSIRDNDRNVCISWSFRVSPLSMTLAGSRFVMANELEIRKYVGCSGCRPILPVWKVVNRTAPFPTFRPAWIACIIRKEDDRFVHVSRGFATVFESFFRACRCTAFRRISRGEHFILLCPALCNRYRAAWSEP